MSLSVVFNGTRLVKPGVASRVVSKLQNVSAAGNNVLGVIGTATGGPLGLSVFTNSNSMRATYRTGDLADAAGVAFNAANDNRLAGGTSAVYAYRVFKDADRPLRSSLLLKNSGGATITTLTARDYGAHTNRITGAVNASNQLTLVFNDGAQTVTEISPATAGAKFTFTYTSGTYTITATQIVFSAGSPAPSFAFATYTTVGDLVAAMNAHVSGNFTAAVVGNPLFPTASLDCVPATNISGTITATGIAQEIVDWANTSSSLVSAVRPASIDGSPVVSTAASFTSGSDGGVPEITDWTAAFTAMKEFHINCLVPLYSAGSLLSGIHSNALAYANEMNSTGGRNEVQVYLGYDANLTTVKSQASQYLNSPHCCLFFDKHTLNDATGNLKVFPAWSSGLIAASMRCAAPLGEPITFKYAQSFGLTHDSSIRKKDHCDELLLAGVSFFENVPGKGIRLVKGNTTYTKTDDDAFTEESVVTTWKVLLYDLRAFLEATFTGTKGTPANVSAISDMTGAKLEEYRKAEAIVDTQDDAGKPLHAWRDLTVTVERDIARIDVSITVVEGINFQLPTISLTPVKLTA